MVKNGVTVTAPWRCFSNSPWSRRKESEGHDQTYGTLGTDFGQILSDIFTKRTGKWSGMLAIGFSSSSRRGNRGWRDVNSQVGAAETGVCVSRRASENGELGTFYRMMLNISYSLLKTELTPCLVHELRCRADPK